MRIVTGSTQIAANAASVRVNLSPSVINDRTLILFTVKGGNSNPNQSMILYDLAADGSYIDFLRQQAGTNVIDITYQLVECNIWRIDRYQGSWTSNNVTINLITNVDTSKAFPVYYMYSDGGTYSSDECFRLTLNTTTIQAVSQNTGTINTAYRIQVVRANGNTFTVTPGSYSQPSGGNFSNAVLQLTADQVSKLTAIISVNAGNSNTTRIGEKMGRCFFTAANEFRVGREQTTTVINYNYWLIEFMEGVEIFHGSEFLINAGITTGGSFNWAKPLSNTVHLPLSANNFMVISSMTADDNLGSTQMLGALSGTTTTTVTYSRSFNGGNARWNSDLIYIPDSVEFVQLISKNNNQSDWSARVNVSVPFDSENNNQTVIALGDSTKLDVISETSNRTDANIYNWVTIIVDQDNSTDTLIGVRLTVPCQWVSESSNTTLISTTQSIVELDITLVESNQTIINIRKYLELEYFAEQSTMFQPNVREQLAVSPIGVTENSEEWKLNPENTNELILNNRQKTEIEILVQQKLLWSEENTHRTILDSRLRSALEWDEENTTENEIRIVVRQLINWLSHNYQGTEALIRVYAALLINSENSDRTEALMALRSVLGVDSLTAHQNVLNLQLVQLPGQIISQSSHSTAISVVSTARPRSSIGKVIVRDKNPIIRVIIDAKTL